MTILFAAGELAGLTASDNSTLETTSPDYFSAPYSRAAVGTLGNNSYAFTPNLGAQSLFWNHFAMTIGGLSSDLVHVTWFTAAGIAVLRMKASGGSAPSGLYFEFLTGSSVWTLCPNSNFSLSGQALNQCDIVITAGVGFKFYTASTLRYNSVTDGATAAMPLISDIAFARFTSGNTISTVSEVIVTNLEPTIGWRLLSDGAINAGSQNSFSGSYADVNEIVLNDATSVNSITAGDISTYAYPQLAVTSYLVRAVVVGMRAKRDITGPQNLKGVVRVGATNYFGPVTALDVGFLGYSAIFATNPATGVAWTPTEAGTAECGQQSIA